MKIAIIYGTKHGGTNQCVKRIKERLVHQADVFKLKDQKSKIKLDNYDAVILGGSIYMGSIQREVKDFCESHLSALLKKKVVLFLCSGFKEAEEFQNNFPRKLVDHSRMNVNLGYMLDRKALGFVERMMVKAIPADRLQKEGLKEDKIQRLAGVMS